MPYVRSADRFLPNGSANSSNGGYWILTNDIVMPEMFGAKRNGSILGTGTDDSGAIQATINYIESQLTFRPPNNPEVSRIACMFSPGIYACHTGFVSHVGARYFAPAATVGGDKETIR